MFVILVVVCGNWSLYFAGTLNECLRQWDGVSDFDRRLFPVEFATYMYMGG